MPFAENIRFMKHLYTQMTNQEPHANVLSLHEQVQGLELRYPGRLKGGNVGDYCLYLNGVSPSHPDMVRAIYSHCRRHGADAAKEILDFLEDMARNGLQGTNDIKIRFIFNGHTYNGREIRVLFYWLILQEDINYPKTNHKGTRMPLTRYTEAVLSSMYPDMLAIENVIRRSAIRGGPPAPCFSHPDLPIRFKSTFNVIENMRRT